MWKTPCEDEGRHEAYASTNQGKPKIAGELPIPKEDA